jgi:hypothetical protein
VTEHEWDGCTDPEKMLEFLRASGRASDRKVRLFAVACCREIWQVLGDGRSRRAVEVAEASAEGLVGEAELHTAWTAAREVSDTSQAEVWQRMAARAAAATVSGPGWGAASAAANEASRAGALAGSGRATAFQEGRRHLGTLLRDVFGPLPFRPVAVDPAWLAWHGGAAGKLAQAVYDERELPSGHLDAARLAVLADMLEEAGCSDPNLLGHLRGPGPHVRGCWAVDLLTGRE